MEIITILPKFIEKSGIQFRNSRENIVIGDAKMAVEIKSTELVYILDILKMLWDGEIF